MGVASFTFLGSKTAAQNRLYSECVEVICGNQSTGRGFGAIAYAQGCARDLIDDERFEERGIFSQIEKIGIRKSGISLDAVGGGVQREHAFLVRDQRIWP